MTQLAEIWNMLTPWQRRGVLAMQAVGANGAGKTTLLDLIAGLLTPAKSSAVFRRMAAVG
jgi:ABC-type Mn2+/Zn2+ transport system ATPase subunit